MADDTAIHHGAGYSDDASRTADRLRERGLELVSTQSLTCGHGDTYRVRAEAPLPRWLHDALGGHQLTAPEGPWPNWGRTDAPIDWPTLVFDHPDELLVDHNNLAHNGYPTWKAITVAWARLDMEQQQPRLDIDLYVSEDNKIQIWPCGLFGQLWPGPTTGITPPWMDVITGDLGQRWLPEVVAADDSMTAVWWLPR